MTSDEKELMKNLTRLVDELIYTSEHSQNEDVKVFACSLILKYLVNGVDSN